MQNTKLTRLIADTKRALSQTKTNLQRKKAELDSYEWLILNRAELCAKAAFTRSEVPEELCAKFWREFWHLFGIAAERGQNGCYTHSGTTDAIDEVVALRKMAEVQAQHEQCKQKVKYEASRLAAFENLAAGYEEFLRECVANTKRGNATVFAMKGVCCTYTSEFFASLGYEVTVHNGKCVIRA